jgi:hypothetical protein
MAELTIQEKAAAFDEAIERARQIKAKPYTAHWDVMKDVVEHVFPQLREPQEKKVINALLYLLQSDYTPSVPIGGIPVEEIISCLKNLEEKCDALSQPSRQEWTVEDEQKLQRCITKVELDIQKWYGHGETMICGDKELITWLNNLKNRIAPQPSPSEKDKDFIRFIGNALTESAASEYLKSKGIELIDAHAWLEELKYRIVQDKSIQTEKKG